MPAIPVNLPEPDARARSHSDAVAKSIRDAIDEAGGAIPFSDYMRRALYAPGLGYYRSGTEKFGVAGDFVTASEISPLFGAVVGRQMAEMLERADGDTVLEIGAGSGRLARDVLRALAATGRLPQRYLILEISAELAARQRKLLAAEPDLAVHIEWLERLPETPFRGVVLANEIADALPVECFHRRDNETLRLGVCMQDEGFAWSEMQAPAWLAETAQTLAARYAWPDDYRSEQCFELAPWIAALAAPLERGGLLLFDYGLPEREYYHPERSSGTLVCHYRHRAHADPFLWPGLTDISAWVDFSALARAGRAAGLEIGGYTTQAHFLLGGDIGEALSNAADERERYRIAAEIQRLALPDEMGENFKAVALVRGCPAPSAFAFRDLRPRL